MYKDAPGRWPVVPAALLIATAGCEEKGQGKLTTKATNCSLAIQNSTQCIMGVSQNTPEGDARCHRTKGDFL